MERLDLLFAALKKDFASAVEAKKSKDRIQLYHALSELDTNLRRLDRELKVGIALAE